MSPATSGRTAALSCLIIALCLSAPTRADSTATVASKGPPAGAHFDTLAAGKLVYHDVTVRSISSRTLMIAHSGGLASVHLRDLSPDLQVAFGYNPAEEAAADAELARAQLAAQRHAKAAAPARVSLSSTDNRMDRVLQKFGTPPEVSAVVDLRPKFVQLDLGVKDQGRRPSCAVFATVSALEFQNAELIGRPEKLSEEYLIWATRKTVKLAPGDTTTPREGDTADEQKDEGFSLMEVVTALRAYGIPLQERMPNTFGKKMAEIETPSERIVEEARNRRRVSIHLIPGRDPQTQLSNMVHALNEGVPVVLALRWPHYRTVRSGFLSAQKPILGYAHAVTVVGYRSASGRLSDTIFRFRNSYGINWGNGGYGEVTYAYLQQHMIHAVVLDVQAEAHRTQ